MRALPEVAFAFAEWQKARVNADYHAAIDGHCYSVPYQRVREQLDVRLSARTVEFRQDRGTGKSFLACALAQKACRDGFSAAIPSSHGFFVKLFAPQRRCMPCYDS